MPRRRPPIMMYVPVPLTVEEFEHLQLAAEKADVRREVLAQDAIFSAIDDILKPRKRRAHA